MLRTTAYVDQSRIDATNKYLVSWGGRSYRQPSCERGVARAFRYPSAPASNALDSDSFPHCALRRSRLVRQPFVYRLRFLAQWHFAAAYEEPYPAWNHSPEPNRWFS